MKHQDEPRHSPEQRDCIRTRLAEGEIGSVDVCDCGLWQLNIGALTLRFAPAAVSELLGLLGHAVAEHAARRLADVAREMQIGHCTKGGNA